MADADAYAAASVDSSATGPELRLTEVVLQTARWTEMNEWYQAFLEQTPCAESSGMCWRRVSSSSNQLLVLFHFPALLDRDRSTTGLNHVQFKTRTLPAAIERYERLNSLGIEPFRCANHGVATAFYYRDPDANTIELSGPNLETESEYWAYLSGEQFHRNPKGVPVDPVTLSARFRAGVPLRELIRMS